MVSTMRHRRRSGYVTRLLPGKPGTWPRFLDSRWMILIYVFIFFGGWWEVYIHFPRWAVHRYICDVEGSERFSATVVSCEFDSLERYFTLRSEPDEMMMPPDEAAWYQAAELSDTEPESWLFLRKRSKSFIHCLIQQKMVCFGKALQIKRLWKQARQTWLSLTRLLTSQTTTNRTKWRQGATSLVWSLCQIVHIDKNTACWWLLRSSHLGLLVCQKMHPPGTNMKPQN